MASCPITPGQIHGETMETVTNIIFLGLKITVDGDSSHEIKRCLLLGRKAITNLDSILKSRDITLPIKVHLVKAMVFPVVMYGCQSWTTKKAEHQITDVFELWCSRKLLSPLDSKEIQPVHPKGNQSWMFIGRTNVEAEAQIFGHLMWRTGSLEKPLMLGKIEGSGEEDDRGCDGWMASLTQRTWVWVSSRSWWWTGRPGILPSLGSQRVRNNWAYELKWTEVTIWHTIDNIWWIWKVISILESGPENKLLKNRDCILSIFVHTQSAITGIVYILNTYISELSLHNEYVHNFKCGDDFTVTYTYTRIHLNMQFQFSQFSRSVVSNSLRPHESQHDRPPCQ